MNERLRIRILVVDDHTMVRRGLATLLSIYDDFEVVGEAANGQVAIELCEQLQPDLVLMDMLMPVMDGTTAARHILDRHPGMRVIAMSSYNQRHMVQDALQAGASGYVLKDVSPDELNQTIRSACIGQITLSPSVAQALIKPAREPLVLEKILTERELAVLELMVEGSGNSAIAGRLHVSPTTIKTHVSNILSKLSVSNRTEAVSLATRYGMTPASS